MPGLQRLARRLLGPQNLAIMARIRRLQVIASVFGLDRLVVLGSRCIFILGHAPIACDNPISVHIITILTTLAGSALRNTILLTSVPHTRNIAIPVCRHEEFFYPLIRSEKIRLPRLSLMSGLDTFGTACQMCLKTFHGDRQAMGHFWTFDGDIKIPRGGSRQIANNQGKRWQMRRGGRAAMHMHGHDNFFARIMRQQKFGLIQARIDM